MMTHVEGKKGRSKQKYYMYDRGWSEGAQIPKGKLCLTTCPQRKRGKSTSLHGLFMVHSDSWNCHSTMGGWSQCTGHGNSQSTLHWDSSDNDQMRTPSAKGGDMLDQYTQLLHPHVCSCALRAFVVTRATLSNQHATSLSLPSQHIVSTTHGALMLYTILLVE